MRQILFAIGLFFCLNAASAQQFNFECYGGYLTGADCQICTGQTTARLFNGLIVRQGVNVFRLIDCPYFIRQQGNNLVVTEMIPNPESVTINLLSSGYSTIAGFKDSIACMCARQDSSWIGGGGSSYYQTWKDDGVSLTQQPNANFIQSDDINLELTNDGANTETEVRADILPNAVNYAEIQQVSANRLLGNPTGSTANVVEIPLATGLFFSGGNLNVADRDSLNEAWTIDADDSDLEVISNQIVKFEGAGINETDYVPASNTLIITGTEVDGSTSNELQTLANTSDATSHTATLSNSGGSIQLIEGSNITLTTGGTGLDGTVTIAATEIDGSITNEGILGVGAGGANDALLTSNTSTANGVTIAGAGIVTIGESTSANGGTITVTGTEVDGSVTNEGSLTVGAGGANTSTIISNTSGSTPVTVSGSNTVLVSESGSTITLQADTSLIATINDINVAANRNDSTFARLPGELYHTKRRTSNAWRGGTTLFQGLGGVSTDTSGVVVVSQGSASTKPSVWFDGDQTIVYELEADSRGDSISDFGFYRGWFDNVSSVGDNQVAVLGFNTSSGGGKKVASRSSMGIHWEEKYNPGAGYTGPFFEFHVPNINFKNSSGGVRPLTGLFGHTAAQGGSWGMNVDNIFFGDYSGNAKGWFSFKFGQYAKGLTFSDSATVQFAFPQVGVDFSRFRNAANSAFVSMFQSDATNRLVINRDGNDIYAYAPRIHFHTLGTITTNDANPVQIGDATYKSFISIYAPSTEVLRLRSNTGGANLWSTYVNADNIVHAMPSGTAWGQFYTNSATIIGANSRIGIGGSPANTLDVYGTARIRTMTGTATTVAGLNGNNEVSSVSIGSGLLLSGNTLSATGSGVTGSAVANQVTYWTGTTSIGGDAGWTFDAATNTQTIDNQVIANNQNANKAILGAPAALTNYPGVWLTNAAISANNAALLGEISSSTTILNAPSTGKVSVRVNNSEIARFKSPGLAIATGADPVSNLDIEGGAVIGATYAGTNSPATNGLLVQGNTSVGTTVSAGRFTAAGSGTTSSTFSGVFQNSSSQNVITIRDDRRVGINTSTQARDLEVTGEVRITDLATDTPTKIVGADADGDLDTVGIGAENELHITAGTLGTNFHTSITPAEITANQLTYNPTGAATAWIWNISADNGFRIIRTITAPGFAKRVTLVNVGSNAILLSNQDNFSGTTAANRFDFGRDVVLFPGKSVDILYNTSASRWKLASNPVYDDVEQWYFNERFNAPVSGSSGDYRFWDIVSANGIGGVAPVAGHMVGVSVNTGSSASGLGYVAAKDVFFENTNAAGTANWAYCKAVIKTPANLSDATNDYTIRIGFADAVGGGGANDGFYFDYNHANVSGNWGCNTTNAGNTQRNNSGIAVAASTIYVLEAFFRPDLTAEYYINGSRVATNDTFVPGGTSDDLLIMAEIEKSAGTAQRDITIYTLQCSIAFVK